MKKRVRRKVQVVKANTFKEVKEESRHKDLLFWILMIGFVALPIAGLMLHLKLHPDYVWLTYILWFDIIAISLMYLSKKTIFYGFMLNTVFFIVGVIAHATVVPGGGISDILISIPDFSIGYALWSLYRGN